MATLRSGSAAFTPVLIALNKPYRLLCQFSGDGTRATLASCVDVPGVYPAGRLDHDSEGLVLLTDDGALQHLITDPAQHLPRRYLVQVEGVPETDVLARLRAGVVLNDGPTLPAEVEPVGEPAWLWPRDPPIRERRAIPTTWMELVIHEGRNRQVRRMCEAVGHPVRRLVRTRIGPVRDTALAPGHWRPLRPTEVRALAAAARPSSAGV